MAAKLILSELPPDQVLIVNAFIAEEHADNRRFCADCERWFGHPVTVVRDQKFNASTLEVYRRHRYIKGLNMAPCTQDLKRRVLGKVLRPDDVRVIGFTAEEIRRAESLEDHFPEEKFRFPLIEHDLSKDDCLAMIDRAGITLPAMYRMGYDNANCIGCPKGGQSYWQAIRRDFPQRFAEMVQIQEDIGPNANFLRFRSGPRAGERMSLRELPEGCEDTGGEPDFSCSFFCQIAEEKYAERG